MIGKKNIVFGFLFLVFTAGLGPYMIVKLFPDVEKAAISKQEPLGRLQEIKSNNYEENMEKLTADSLSQANTDGVVALNNAVNARSQLDSPRSVHAHGNLEAVLNIVAGIVLCFIAVARVFKQVISWVFIAGAVTHSGMLYLGYFGQAWAWSVLQVGPWLVLLGFLLIGIAAFIGFKGEIVKD